jgi:large subunit ribosomal protein L2
MKKELSEFYVKLVLPSGSLYSVALSSAGLLGKTSNSSHRFTKIGKAGRNRWKGIRPSVRGVAMNPVDHPHGGGEGKSSGTKQKRKQSAHRNKGRHKIMIMIIIKIINHI